MSKQNLKQLVWARRGRGLAALLPLIALAACSDSPAAPRTGSLVVTIAGLPAGAQNAVSVSGPPGTGFTRQLSVTDTLRGLTAGSYTVEAHSTSSPTGTYVANTPSQQVQVSVSSEPAHVAVDFVITTASLAFNVNGLPQGAVAAITVNGPEGYRRDVTQSVTLTNLAPGPYSITNSSVQLPSGHVYSVTPLAQSLTLVPSETPRNVNANYALATGALEVAVSGLPQGVSADLLVTGPGGFSKTVTASTTFLGLFPATYTVTASNVAGGTAVYAPTPTSQPLTVTPSLTPVRATVAYSEVNAQPPPNFNLSIDGMYVTQAVQSYSGAVPMVAGMPALVRVFVKASAPNAVYPSVRLKVFSGSTLSQTITIQPNTPGVPTSVAEGNLLASWNAILPASVIQPGLRLQADVDPINTIIEGDEGDNLFPLNGNLMDVPVVFTSRLNVTFVPVFQTTSGLTGGITTQNLDDFTSFLRKIMPVKDYRFTLHETFSTSAPALASNDQNSWFQILGEINTLRVAEGNPDYYVGIVGTSYSSGIAGLAFTPGRAAVAWDKLPNASQITAHELGHTLGRLHTPCGGAGGADSLYPYPLGQIGVYGYDISSGLLKPPVTSDIMGYCGFGWISDYHYVGILNYRATTSGAAISPAVSRSIVSAQAPREAFIQSGSEQSSLVVWGRIVDGKPILEPAFSARTRPVLPSSTGPHRIEGLAADGRVVFAYTFEGEEPSDVSGRTVRQFSFAIPMDAAAAQSIVRIRLTSANGARVEQVASTVAAKASVDAIIDRPGELSFRLTDSGIRFAVVRARTTGRIVAFLRGQGPAVRVRSGALDFDVQYSDGVRSTFETVRAKRR